MLRRVLRVVLKVVLAIVGAVVLLFFALWIVLRPPQPLDSPTQGVVLSGLTVINPGVDRASGRTIIVKGGRIAAVTDRPSPDVPSDAARFAGDYALPGLIDMHVHNPPARASADLRYFFLMYLANGVTTVRDTGNDGFMLEMRAESAEGKIAGPRIFTCGPILDGDPPVWPFSRVVHNAAEADRVVDDLAARGADFIKVYDRLTPDALAGIERAAKRHGLAVIGHVPELVPFEDAHIDDVQHLTGVPEMPNKVFLNYGDLFAVRAQGWQGVDERRIKFIVNTSIAQHIAHTPTIVVNDRISRLYDYDAQLRDPVASLVPVWYPQLFWRPPVSSDGLKAFDQAARALNTQISKMKLVVKRLHEAGVTVHVGTDTLNPFVVPGESLHEEMRNFLDAGYTPEQVWQAATIGNGASLPMPGLGRLQAGAPADFVILKEDPTKDLGAIGTLQAVVANGRLYTTEELGGALTRYRARFASPSYRYVLMTLMGAANRSIRQPSAPHGNTERP